jgi:hypothetical protein
MKRIEKVWFRVSKGREGRYDEEEEKEIEW